MIDAGPTPKEFGIYHARLRRFLDAGYFPETNITARLVRAASAANLCVEAFAVPPGRAMSFADAAAQAFRPVPDVRAESFGPSWSTHWLRIAVDLDAPARWPAPAGKTRVQFRSAAEGLVWSSDGRPVHGTSGERDSFPLALVSASTESRRVVFYVEIDCNNIAGNASGGSVIAPPDPHRTYRVEECRLVHVDADVRRLHADLETLEQIVASCGEDGNLPGKQALHVANEIINAFGRGDVSACQSIADSFFGRAQSMHTDTAGDFAPGGHLAPTVYAVGHCHIDTAWLWRTAQTRKKTARSWASQLAMADAHPSFVFAFSQAQQMAWLRADYPSLWARIKAASAVDGACGSNANQCTKDPAHLSAPSMPGDNTFKPFAPLGGAWVEMDGNLPDGESFARQLVHGQAELLREFGRTSEVFWLPDTFGYTAQLPQVCALAGLRFFVSTKLSWNQVNRVPHSSFWWVAPDGSRVLAHFPPAGTYTSDAGVADIRRTAAENRDRDRTGAAMLLYGEGDGGGGPHERHVARLERLAAARVPGLPAVRLATPAAFFARLVADDARRPLLSWAGELYFELHRGTYTSQAGAKRMNRLLEAGLAEAECAAVFAHVAAGRAYPRAAIRAAWDALLLNQFHDILPGSSIGSVYEDALAAYAAALEGAQRVRDASLDALSAPSGAGGRDRLLVFNPSSHARCEVVKDPSSGRLFWTGAIPPLSIQSIDLSLCSAGGESKSQSLPNDTVATAIHNLSLSKNTAPDGDDAKLQPGFAVRASGEQQSITNPSHVRPTQDCAPAAGVHAEQLPDGGVLFDNGVLRAVLDARGNLTSLIDARTGRELVDARGEICPALGSTRTANGLYLYDDVPHFWDAWDVELYVTERGVCLTDAGAEGVSVSLALVPGDGALRRTAVRTVSVCRTRTTVRQEIWLDAGCRRLDTAFAVDWRESHKLLRLAFPLLLRTHEAVYGAPFGLVRRPTHANTSWDVARFEVCGHGWAALEEAGFGAAVLSDCKYGYAARGGTLELSLLRAPRMPDDACDVGTHAFRVALAAFDAAAGGLAAVVRHAAVLRQPLVVRPGCAAGGAIAPFALTGGLVVSALKLAEDDSGDVVVRAYEPVGARGCAQLRLDVQSQARVCACDLLERPMGESLAESDGFWSVPFRPFQIITLRIAFAK